MINVQIARPNLTNEAHNVLRSMMRLFSTVSRKCVHRQRNRICKLGARNCNAFLIDRHEAHLRHEATVLSEQANSPSSYSNEQL